MGQTKGDAFEVVRRLAERGVETAWEPVAVAFSNEEGALFPQPFWGSKVLTGRWDGPAEPRDRTGWSLREPLRLAGGDLDAVAAAAWPAGRIAAFLELHIEQGPVLEHHEVVIGVVEAITGRTVFDIAVRGQQNHAGTTPMALRRDALAAAARVVLAVQSLAREDGRCAVATVGRIDCEPNVVNAVAGTVRMTAEIRDTSAACLLAAERALHGKVERIAAATGVSVSVDATRVAEPARTDPVIQRAIAAAAAELALPSLSMSSGAGHDAQIVAGVAPVGMIFVPSRDGVSHAPSESTADEHLVAGAETLLRTAWRMTVG